MRDLIWSFLFCLSLCVSMGASAQSIHNHNQFHGLSSTIQPNLPQGTEGLFIEYRWRNNANADFDGHLQLPASAGPFVVTQSNNFSRNDQPFSNGAQIRRIYPSQAGVQFNGGTALAFHSGDQGGGAPAGVGCVEPNGGSCELITVSGNVPTARYGIGIHNFNFFNQPTSVAEYDIVAYATNGTAYIEGHESHLATNSISGRLDTTGQSHLDVVNFTFTGNPPHAIGVPELISTLGHSVGPDRVQNLHIVNSENSLGIEKAMVEVAEDPTYYLSSQYAGLYSEQPSFDAQNLSESELRELRIQSQLELQKQQIYSEQSTVVQAILGHWDRNELNQQPEYSYLEIQAMVRTGDARRMLPEKSVFHQFTSDENSNEKYVSRDGKYEWVFDKYGNLINSGEDAGSYNYADPDNFIGHLWNDVVPYYLWGNNSSDKTKLGDRITCTWGDCSITD